MSAKILAWSNNAPQEKNYVYYNFLSMLFLTIMLGTYVLAYKMVALGNYVESGGIFIFPINYALIDIVTEVYGFEQTKKLIKQAFICCFLFAAVVPFIAKLPPPNNFSHQAGYDFIFGGVVRFFIANTLGIIIGIWINSYLLSKWKILLNGKHFWFRSIVSSAIGELITSIIADIIAFLGTGNVQDLLKLMLAIYFVKFSYALFLAWPLNIIMVHLKYKEGIGVFDKNVYAGM